MEIWMEEKGGGWRQMEIWMEEEGGGWRQMEVWMEEEGGGWRQMEVWMGEEGGDRWRSGLASLIYSSKSSGGDREKELEDEDSWL
ncbi:hypothetical protein ACOMHN_015693 [Nucella lapillus]